MSEYQDVEQIRDRQGYIIAFQALDVVTGEPVVLKAKNGALQVDLRELEDISITVEEVNITTTDDVITVSPVVGEKTITSTAAALFAGASPLASRQFMRVHNLSLEQQILVGPSTVANTGFPIEPGGEVLLKFNKEVPVALYGISSGAAAKVRVMEA